MKVLLVENIRLKQKVNTIENEKEILEKVVKDKLYDTFMSKLSETQEIDRLTKENRRLRKNNKLLKQILKEPR